LKTILSALSLALCCSTVLLGQVDSGAVSGVVRDQSGAVIPGARVVVTRLDTNAQSELRTNNFGLYTVPVLRPGLYEITVTKDGFQAQKSQPFDLRVQDRAEVNFQLYVRAASDEITVSAAAPLLESATSSLGEVIQEKAVTDLPLNGRNFIQLATLTAGTLPSTRTAERDNFISNGARAVQNSYLLDGADNKNRILGFDKGSAQIVQPIIDAIQEFKVQTSTFSAEFGQAAGGVVNVTMKSGTNDFHGNLFEFLRNSAMDATPYFQPAGQGKPNFIQNQFGGTFGGRVVRDRTFFFGAWQTSREVAAAPQIGTVPTEAMRQGIFPTTVKDPLTKANFPQNTIPLSRWDPLVPKLLALYPLPNLTGVVNNFFYDPKERVSVDAYNVRIDHRFGDRDSLSGRYSQNTGENQLPNTLPDPANQQGFVNLTGRSLAISETHLFASNKVNELRFGFSYTYSLVDLFGPRLFDEFGIKGALDEARIKGLPTFAINSESTLGSTGPGAIPISASGSSNFPAEKSGRLFQVLDTFSWIRGRHALKVGTDLERITMTVYATNSARPGFTFNGQYTGVGLGDFLLGYVQNVSTSQQQRDTITQNVFNGFVQDDWKATARLTLNLGVRYELSTPFTEAQNRQSNFILEAGPCYLQLVSASDAGRCGVGPALTRTNYNNFAPRLGLAYEATPKTVIRSGFGIFYGRDETVGITARLPNNPPFVTSATFTGDQTRPALLLQDGLPANALSQATGSDLRLFPLDFPTPSVIQWNLNIERQLPGELVAQVAYTGSEAHRMPMVVNINQAFPGVGDVNARRPYLGYGVINEYGPFVNSSYHALLGKLEHRFSKGFSVLASYTYGHSIDNGKSQNDSNDPAPQNARDLTANRASSNYDIRHQFAVSGLWALPFQGRGVTTALVRGWQLSGILSAHTGLPFTVTLNRDPTASGTTARPNRVADGSLPPEQRSASHWFDTMAFVAPTCVCFGNSGRDILRGPGFMNLDLGVTRNFNLRDRINMQLRIESFNVTNRPNLGSPNATIGDAKAGTITSVENPERQTQVAVKLYF
jgi:hypothetical protein